MGSSVTIFNDTDVILNIALSQIGPLYYENAVQPGQCAKFTVGKVWFTVEGRVWNGDNEYDGIQVARPIIDATLEAVMIFMLILTNGRNAIGYVGRVGEKLAQAKSEVKAAHESDTTNNLLQRLFNGSAINSPGWYFGNDRCISISGGPKYVSVVDEDNDFHKIDVNTLHNSFEIKDRL